MKTEKLAKTATRSVYSIPLSQRSRGANNSKKKEQQQVVDEKMST